VTITIPVWLLWTLGLAVGIPILIVLLLLAYIGFMFVSVFSPPRW
jgi:hypothetical protein